MSCMMVELHVVSIHLFVPDVYLPEDGFPTAHYSRKP